jgi:hypothetical protein
MIRQNSKIAEQISVRQQSLSLVELVCNFSVEEWEEYLLYLIYRTYECSNDWPIFEMRVDYEFKIGVNPNFPHTGRLDVILSHIEPYLTPKTKAVLSQAIHNLQLRYKGDIIIIRALFNSLSTYMSDFIGQQLATYFFGTLEELIESNDTSAEIKALAILEIGELTGIQRPSKLLLVKTLIAYRNRFRNTDLILGEIMNAFISIGAYKQAFKTLKCLTTEWSSYDAFDDDIVRMITGHYFDDKPTVIRKVEAGVGVKYVLLKVVPFLSEAIRQKFVVILRRRSMLKTRSADNRTTEYFFVTEEEASLIKQL